MVTLRAGSRCCAVSNKKHRNQTHMQTSDRTYKTHQIKPWGRKHATHCVWWRLWWTTAALGWKSERNIRTQCQEGIEAGFPVPGLETHTPHPHPSTHGLSSNTHAVNQHTQNLFRNEAENVACYCCKHFVWRDILEITEEKAWIISPRCNITGISSTEPEELTLSWHVLMEDVRTWTESFTTINRFLTRSYAPEYLISTDSDHISHQIERKKNISVLGKQRKLVSATQ